ncbi:MAG: DUF11 domain-containing protein [Gammaproteobacteria bacterium]|nr:DUF11 domain-containing protein [Gammaproteobacteria bacterium]
MQNASAVTPPGTVISNTANAAFTFDGADRDSPSNAADVTVAVGSTPSEVRFLQYLPSGQGATGTRSGQGATGALSGPTACATGSVTGEFAPLKNPTYPGGEILDITGSLPLIATRRFHQGEPVFIELTDLDQSLDATALDTVQITVSDAKTRDREVLQLSETDMDTGVFLGFIQSVPPPSEPFDCELAISSDTNVNVDYVDPFDEADTSVARALVDPLGIVFDSTTGAPVEDASVAIVDALTGQPATVFGDDGVSRFPATLTSGGSATDSGGTVYQFPAGGYRFPFLAPGSYRIEATPSDAYAAPSSVPVPELQALPGAPFALNLDASFGDDFALNAGPPLNVDIPVDPLIGTLALTKIATREQVAIGDFVQYRLEVSNTSATVTAAAVVLDDHLPSGFRYQEGSAAIEGGCGPNPWSPLAAIA